MTKKTKGEIRKEILEKRNATSRMQRMLWDADILSRVENLSLERQGTVFLYAAVRGEAGTELLFSFFREKGCRVAFPKVEGEYIRFYAVTKWEEMVPGKNNIPEPPAESEPVHAPDCPVFVPGLAFSCNGWRIGYGGGFYDRFFAKEPGHEKIALAYDFQMYGTLPHEAWDSRVDKIITPKRVIETTKSN